jgi:hypothetical protein
MILKKPEKKEFEPFELNLFVETEQEARLLFHVFNRLDLKEAIFSELYAEPNQYNDDMLNSLIRSDIKDYIRSKVRIDPMPGEKEDG